MAATFTNLLYHIVFSTKHRQPTIAPSLQSDLYSYIGGIIRGEGGVLIEIGGTPDHVHLVTNFKSEPSLAQMIKTFKAKSSVLVPKLRLGTHFHEAPLRVMITACPAPATRFTRQNIPTS